MTESSSPDPGHPGAGTPRGLLPAEWKAVGGLAGIYAARMLGLFLMFPVLALYSRGLPGGTALLAGLSVGAYGLTQAVLQIPFGVLSDRFGRRPLIAIGLALYALGSFLGAVAGTVGGVILARMVQGAGAVSGPVSALVADLTRPEVRTRAMALIGVSIGGAFIVSLVGAPLLAATVGVPGIFGLMGLLAFACLALLYGVVPRPGTASGGAPRVGRIGAAFAPALLPHYLGIFVLNGVLSAAFVGVPFALRDTLGVAVADHWKTYLGAFLASIPPTVPLILWSDRGRRAHVVFPVGIALLALALGALGLGYHGYWALAAALAIFFTAFNYLEARLPAALSQAVGPELRGAALSVFATAQFLGSFGGATAAGWLAGRPTGLGGLFAAAALAALAWLAIHAAAGRPAKSGDQRN